MVYTGEDTPYNQNKNKTPDATVGELVTSDKELNACITDYIASNAEMATLLSCVSTVATVTYLDYEEKLRLIRCFTQDYSKV